MTSPLTTPIPVVLAGCGGISNAWLKTDACRELVRIVGLVDLDLAAAQRLQQAHDLDQSVIIGRDLATVIKDSGATVVFDCTVPEAHHTITTTALAAGCHVLGEKPMAADMAQAQEMVAAARASGLLYAVTQTRRWNPQARRLQAFLASGAIGTVHSVHADFFIAAHFGGFRASMDHVLLLDMAIHTFDMARMFTPGSPRSVVADEWNPVGSWYRHGASACACFRFDEAMFSYRGSWTATGAQTSWESAWRIIGSAGAVTWDGYQDIQAEGLVDPAQASAEDGGDLIRALGPIPVPADCPTVEGRGHDGAIRHFISCLLDGRQPETAAADNIKSLAMVHAAIASAASACRQEVWTAEHAGG